MLIQNQTRQVDAWFGTESGYLYSFEDNRFQRLDESACLLSPHLLSPVTECLYTPGHFNQIQTKTDPFPSCHPRERIGFSFTHDETIYSPHPLRMIKKYITIVGLCQKKKHPHPSSYPGFRCASPEAAVGSLSQKPA